MIEKLWLAFFGRPKGLVGWLGSRLMPLLSRRLNKPMASALDLRADDDLLDVGCGSGGFLAYAAPQVRSVAGLDASALQVRMGQRRLRDRLDAGTAVLVLGDAETLSWDDGHFSALSSLNCLKFVADPDRALAEMRRVLRAGGRMAILVDTPVAAAESGAVDDFGQRQWSSAEIARLVEDEGFVDVAVRQLPTSYYRLQLIRGVKPS
ncbi:MAG: class I SAM-dependent methyltransferase [Angustibacter sp.]